MGRRSTYDSETAALICDQLAEGKSLRSICLPDDMPTERAVRSWALCDAGPGFAAQYARARSLGIDALAEGTVDIADDLTEDPNSRRVRVDARKWFASKMRPDKYGDRVSLDGKLGLEVNDLTKIRANVTAVIAATNLPPEIQSEIGRRLLAADDSDGASS